MEYVQLSQDLSEAIQVTTHGNVEWSPVHYCPAAALTPTEAAEFRVFPLTVTEAPTEFNPVTQKVQRTGCELVDGVWQYKWTISSKFTETTAEDGTVITVEEQEAAALAQAEVQAAEQFKQSIITAVQARLDTFARTRNYDGIMSAATYATSATPNFAAEGKYAVDVRDATWSTLYEVLSEVQAGTRPVPVSYQDIEPLLPVLTWPV